METVTVDSGTHAGSHVPVADLLSILTVSLKEDKETDDKISVELYTIMHSELSVMKNYNNKKRLLEKWQWRKLRNHSTIGHLRLSRDATSHAWRRLLSHSSLLVITISAKS
jgi:hypothetical protein